MGDFRVSCCTKAYIVLLCTIFSAVLCTGFGKCPLYPMLPDFDVQRMTGIWYEVERSFYMVEITASCTELNVTLNDKGHLLITLSTVNRWTGNPSTSYGLGIPSSPGASTFRYRLNNRLPYAINRLLPGAGQYQILFTDYDQYAIIWSCTSIDFAHTDNIWVLGRLRELSATVRAEVYSIMTELALDPDRLILSKNTNCNATHTKHTVAVTNTSEQDNIVLQ